MMITNDTYASKEHGHSSRKKKVVDAEKSIGFGFGLGLGFGGRGKRSVCKRDYPNFIHRNRIAPRSLTCAPV